MNDLERYVFRRFAEREVIQGPLHRRKILDMYCVIVAAARSEFYEDNDATLGEFLNEIHNEALGVHLPFYTTHNGES